MDVVGESRFAIRSTASRRSESSTPVYTLAVVAMLECPSNALTVLRSTPAASHSVAAP